MKYFVIAVVIFIGGCTSIPYDPETPLFALEDMFDDQRTCKVLVDRSRAPVAKNNRFFAVWSKDCPDNIKGRKLAKANEITLTTGRAKIIYEGAGALTLYRRDGNTYGTLWTNE